MSRWIAKVLKRIHELAEQREIRLTAKADRELALLGLDWEDLREAAGRLGVSPQAVTGRRSRRTILAVPMPNGEWVYPVCQFTDEGLVSGVGTFLREFRDVAPWTQLAVLLASSARHGGRSALALLLAGKEEAARSIAATYGDQG